MLERIDRYLLKERIGVGGQATVYLGEDTLLGRTVAVKLMNQMVSTQSEYVDTLMSEARLAAGLSHPNIATVYDHLRGICWRYSSYGRQSLRRRNNFLQHARGTDHRSYTTVNHIFRRP